MNEIQLLSPSPVGERVECWRLQYRVVTATTVWEHGWSLTRAQGCRWRGKVRKDLEEKDD